MEHINLPVYCLDTRHTYLLVSCLFYLKAHSHPVKAKILFEVCRLFYDLFRFRFVWKGPYCEVRQNCEPYATKETEHLLYLFFGNNCIYISFSPKFKYYVDMVFVKLTNVKFFWKEIIQTVHSSCLQLKPILTTIFILCVIY